MALATDSDASASSSDELSPSLSSPASASASAAAAAAAAASQPPPPLASPDREIADALHAWLTAVSPVPPTSPTFAAATVVSSLCAVLSAIAPTHLSTRDFFTLGAPTSPAFLRQLRYNVRRLARSLTAWFALPPADAVAPPRLAAPAADSLDLLVTADSPAAADVRSALALAEAVLCVAVHGAARDNYIKAVLALPSRQQDALALSIRRTGLEAAQAQSPEQQHQQELQEQQQHQLPQQQPQLQIPQHPHHLHNQYQQHLHPHHQPQAQVRSPLTPAGPSPENDENVARGAAAAAAAAGMTSPSPLSPGGIAIVHGNVVGTALSRASSFGDSDSRLAAPAGVALADFKALASERDNLRRKLTNADAECARLHDVEDTLRKSLDDAADRLRDLASEKGRLEETLAEKLNALADAQDSLRAAHVSAEEIDALRTKAQTVENLEVSLKRATKRLEESVALRKTNQNLEAQLAAFRESEAKTSKHVAYLEGQLTSSNERAQKLVDLSDGLSRDIEEKDAKIAAGDAELADVRHKLTTANKQLESMLLQSCATKAQTTTVTSSRSPDAESYVEAPASSSESSPKSQSDQVDEESSPEHAVVAETAQSASANVSSHVPYANAGQPQAVSEEQVKAMVTTMLRDRIGVTVGWEDIVECVVGVTDAMREMDEMAHLQTNAPNMEDPLAPPARISSGLAAQAAITRQRSRSVGGGASRSGSMAMLTRPSQTSVRSAESGSDAQSRVSILPEFSTFDAKLKAASTGQGDEFDYAANCINVREIQVGDPTEEESSSFDSEDDEDDDEGWEEHVDGLSGGEEHIDATVNATTGVHGRQQHAVAPQLFAGPTPSATESTERKSPASEGCHSSSDPIPPDMMPRGTSVGPPPSRSMTLTVVGGISRSTSRSEAASAIARQTRHDLATLRQAMETMRVERQSNASVTALVGQLDKARAEMAETQTRLKQSEAECENLRRELNILLKEMDSQMHQASVERERSAQVLAEKERLVTVLQESVREKNATVERLDKEVGEMQRRVDVLDDEKKSAERRVEAAQVIERAHDVEMAKLKAKLEANEELTLRLNKMVEQTDGLRSELTRQHESQLHDVTESVKREKRIAEEARAEARRLAEANASVLQDVRASAQAAALAHNQHQQAAVLSSSAGEDQQRSASRRSSRFGDFWRRLLLRERVAVDFSMPTSMSMGNDGSGMGNGLPRSFSGRKATKTRTG